MTEEQIAGLVFAIAAYLSGAVCVFPLQQSIEEKHTPTIIFAIACMVGMLILGTALLIKCVFI